MATSMAVPRQAYARPNRVRQSPARTYAGDIDAYSKDEPAAVRSMAASAEDMADYQVAPAAPPPPGYGNRYTGTNLERMIQSDRELALGRGDELYQRAKDREGTGQQQSNFYGGYADEVYDPLIGGRGGFNERETDGIVRERELQSGMTTDQQFQDMELTPDEQNAIRGNPWSRGAYFNPDAMLEIQRDSAQRQRGAVDQLGNDLTGAIGNDLDVREGYGDEIDATLSGTEGRVRGAVDPTRLRASEEALNRIRMTPEEEQRIVTGAGISAGTGYRAAMADTERRSRAAGIDPVGAAAVRGRYMRQSAADAGDAMTQARIAASGARAGREATAEGIRMGGEGTAAGMMSSNELALGRDRVGANERGETLRLGAARDQSNRRMDVANTTGQARITGEQQINAQGRQQQQFNATTGTEMATGIERDESERSRYIAGNRQDVRQNAANTRFQQTAGVNSELSRRNETVANARRGDAQEGRGYLRQRQDQANSNVNAEAGRQVQAYGVQTQAAQNTTQAQQTQQNQPRWWEKVAGMAIGGATAAAGFKK